MATKRSRKMNEKPLLLECGAGFVEVVAYSTDGPDGKPDGVAFRINDAPNEIGASNPTVKGTELEAFNPAVCFHFTNPESAQVVIDFLEIVRDALAE
jgi:hypothetical protein